MLFGAAAAGEQCLNWNVARFRDGGDIWHAECRLSPCSKTTSSGTGRVEIWRMGSPEIVLTRSMTLVEVHAVVLAAATHFSTTIVVTVLGSVLVE